MKGRQWKKLNVHLVKLCLEKPFNLDINPEHSNYFDSIKKGGLLFPSYFLFNIKLLCISRVRILISCVKISKTLLLAPLSTIVNTD